MYVLSFITSLSLPVLSTSHGICKTWPMYKVLLVKLFLSIIASGVVLYLNAILYKVSPFWTTYSKLSSLVIKLSGLLFGNTNSWPM